VNPSSSRSSKLISAALVERAAIKLPSKKEESSSMDFNRFIDRHDLFNCESREPQAPAHSRFTQSCFIVHNTCVNNWILFTDEKQRQTFVSSRVS